MNMLRINQIIAGIIDREGGYVNNPHDHGGPTKYGITKASYADYFQLVAEEVETQEIQQLTKALAFNIYYRLYYQRPGIDRLPEAIQPIMLDMAVNQGQGSAIRLLQSALTAQGYSVGKHDGLIGPKTINLSNLAMENLGDYFINSLVNFRISFYHQLISNDPSQREFEQGWLTRAEAFRVLPA